MKRTCFMFGVLPKDCRRFEFSEKFLLGPARGTPRPRGPQRARGGRPPPSRPPAPCAAHAGRLAGTDWQNFGRMLLVFGCIGTDLRKKILVLQHFSKSTKSTKSSKLIFWNLDFFLQILQHLQKKLNVYRSCWIFQTDFLQIFEIAAVQKCAHLVDLEKCW